jgi:hypothetical protein
MAEKGSHRQPRAALLPFAGPALANSTPPAPYIPPDTRANRTVTQEFVRARGPIIPKVKGTAAIGYPAGNSVKPVKSLFGTWKNISLPCGLAKIVLGRNPDGSPSVHAFGRCHPTLCDWGVVNGITFGTYTYTARFVRS